MVLKIHNNNKECQDGKFLYFARGIIYNDYRFSVTIYNTSISTNINEINNIPGSLSFYLWEKTNKEYPELLEDIINLGIVNYKNKNKKTITFKNNILEGFNGLKGVKGIKK